MPSTPPLTGRVRFADFEVDLDTGELRRDGKFVPIQRLVARTLVMLVARAGHLVPRDELVGHLWGDTVVEYDLGLNNTIRTLRNVLGDDARSPRFVETSPRRGYRFVAPVESAVSSVPQAEDVVARAAPAAGRVLWDGSPAKRSVLLPVAMLASGLALAVALGSLWVTVKPGKQQAATVAVLPFSGTGPNADILGSSLAEELTRELTIASAGPLRVIGTASAARAFREESELERVAKRLGASHLVVGSLVNKGDTLSLEIRIVRATDTTVSWKEGIASTWTEALTAQRKLARHIAARLSRGVGDAGDRSERTLPLSPAAIASYLQGRHLVARGSARDAIPLLEAVVSAEPSFVPGRTALGEAMLMVDAAAAAEGASRLAAEALALAPEDGRAHLLRAKIALSYEWDWQVAERHLSRALELAPSDASVHLAHAIFLGSLARHREAKAAAEIAQGLDPLSSIVQGDLAMLCFWRGDWDGVLRESTRLLELEPEGGVARSLRLEGLLRQRRWQDARIMAIALSGRGTGFETVDGPGIGPRYLAIQQERWERAESSALRSMILATLAAEQGRDDDALRLLKEAVRQRSCYVPFLAVDPHFRSLAQRSEFRQLLAEVNHPLARSLPFAG